MNKKLKVLLIIINIIMMILSIYWYIDKKETEPIIVFLGQIATLVALVFEKPVSNILTRKIHDNSSLDVDVQSGDNVDTKNVKNSKINIKTRK